MKAVAIFYLLLFFGCTIKKPDPAIECEVLNFIDKKEYIYSVKKGDIPDIVLDSIRSENEGPFNIADHTDSGKVNISDKHISTSPEYNIELHFALIHHSHCLIVYTEQACIGSHDIVDYFQYGEPYKHLRYASTDRLNDTTALRVFLLNNPTLCLHR